jgi:hypothetical protein
MQFFSLRKNCQKAPSSIYAPIEHLVWGDQELSR